MQGVLMDMVGWGSHAMDMVGWGSHAGYIVAMSIRAPCIVGLCEPLSGVCEGGAHPLAVPISWLGCEGGAHPWLSRVCLSHG